MDRVFVYAIGTEDGPVKVGITRNLSNRLCAIQNGSAQKLEFIYVYTAFHQQEALDMERWFHDVWSHKRLNGEWFDIPSWEAAESLEIQVDFAFSGPHAKLFHARREAFDKSGVFAAIPDTNE